MTISPSDVSSITDIVGTERTTSLATLRNSWSGEEHESLCRREEAFILVKALKQTLATAQISYGNKIKYCIELK